jgi:hypothetical protein
MCQNLSLPCEGRDEEKIIKSRGETVEKKQKRRKKLYFPPSLAGKGGRGVRFTMS